MDERVMEARNERAAERMRRHGPRLFLGAIFVVGAAAALLGDGGWLAGRQLEAQVLRQSVEIAERSAAVERLRARLGELREDVGARERIAREQLGYAGRGEVIFLLPRDGEGKSPTP